MTTSLTRKHVRCEGDGAVSFTFRHPIAIGGELTRPNSLIYGSAPELQQATGLNALQKKLGARLFEELRCIKGIAVFGNSILLIWRNDQSMFEDLIEAAQLIHWALRLDPSTVGEYWDINLSDGSRRVLDTINPSTRKNIKEVFKLAA